MSKNSYPHGFLYHPDSQQILLQQKVDEQSVWTLLGGIGGEDFQHVIAKILNFKLGPKAIRPVYDYSVKGERHFVSYVEVKKAEDFPATKKLSFAWFSVKQLTKLPLSNQTKQDIIVGRRVIESESRRDAGELTIG